MPSSTTCSSTSLFIVHHFFAWNVPSAGLVLHRKALWVPGMMRPFISSLRQDGFVICALQWGGWLSLSTLFDTYGSVPVCWDGKRYNASLAAVSQILLGTISTWWDVCAGGASFTSDLPFMSTRGLFGAGITLISSVCSHPISLGTSVLISRHESSMSLQAFHLRCHYSYWRLMLLSRIVAPS